MNPIWRRLGHIYGHGRIIGLVLAFALIFLGAVLGNSGALAMAGPENGISAREKSSGGLESALAAGVILLMGVVVYVGWRWRCCNRQWLIWREDAENVRRRLEDQLSIKTEEGQRLNALCEQEKREAERCRAELKAEKEQGETARMDAQKLKPLGVLASGIAHDFNNILTIVIGNVSLAKITACAPEDRQRWLDRAERAALRAKALTQQLLALSKDGPLLKKRAEVRELLQDAVRLAAPGQPLRFEYRLAEDLWPVEVDAGQVIQALEALVMQADRQMPEGTALIFQADNQSLGAGHSSGLPPGDYAHLTLRCPGSASQAERLGQLFNSTPGRSMRDDDYHLAAAHGIIKRHSGSITFEFLAAKDLVFHVYLPASAVLVPEVEASPAAPLGVAGRILVMDDEEGIRQVAMVMLKQLGYETAVTRDGLEALEFYRAALRRQQPFDLVILDLTVPGGLGGKETVQRLRQIDTQAKVLVSSGYFNDPVMAHYRHYGFDGVIAKPYKMEELATVVSAVVNPRSPSLGRSARGEM